MDHQNILEFLNEGWNGKLCSNIVCEIDLGSVSIKYMIKSQIFTVRLFYGGYHFVNGIQVSLDIAKQDEEGKIIDIEIYINNEIKTTISFEKQRNLFQLHADMINKDKVDLPGSFLFKVRNSKMNI